MHEPHFKCSVAMWLVAVMSDNTGKEHFHYCGKVYWIALLCCLWAFIYFDTVLTISLLLLLHGSAQDWHRGFAEPQKTIIWLTPTLCQAGTVLEPGNMSVNTTDKIPCFKGAHCTWQCYLAIDFSRCKPRLLLSLQQQYHSLSPVPQTLATFQAAGPWHQKPGFGGSEDPVGNSNRRGNKPFVSRCMAAPLASCLSLFGLL